MLSSCQVLTLSSVSATPPLHAISCSSSYQAMLFKATSVQLCATSCYFDTNQHLGRAPRSPVHVTHPNMLGLSKSLTAATPTSSMQVNCSSYHLAPSGHIRPCPCPPHTMQKACALQPWCTSPVCRLRSQPTQSPLVSMGAAAGTPFSLQPHWMSKTSGAFCFA